MQGRNTREQLQRVLRTPEVLFIGINGVVGGGIFLLPGQVAQSAGAAAVWAYLAAGFVVGWMVWLLSPTKTGTAAGVRLQEVQYPVSAPELPAYSILGNSEV